MVSKANHCYFMACIITPNSDCSTLQCNIVGRGVNFSVKPKYGSNCNSSPAQCSPGRPPEGIATPVLPRWPCAIFITLGHLAT